MNNNITVVYSKLLLTIESYKDRFPELCYIHNALDKIIDNHQHYKEKVWDLLNIHLKKHLLHFYVIRIIQSRFEEDLEAIKNGLILNNDKTLYLEFAK